MDPQAAWDEMQAAHQADDRKTVRELARSLFDWLARGGFPPVTCADGTLSPDQHRKVAEEFCRRALRRTAEI